MPDQVLSVRARNQALTILIPDMNFTCNGTIQAVSIVGMPQTRGDVIMRPRLQLWRETGDPNVYTLEQTITLRASACVGGLVMITDSEASRRKIHCILHQNVRADVHQGDILGIELPNKNRDSFELYFTKGGPMNYVFSGRNLSTASILESSMRVAQQPLLEVEVAPQGTMPRLYFSYNSCTLQLCIGTSFSVLKFSLVTEKSTLMSHIIQTTISLIVLSLQTALLNHLLPPRIILYALLLPPNLQSKVKIIHCHHHYYI